MTRPGIDKAAPSSVRARMRQANLDNPLVQLLLALLFVGLVVLLLAPGSRMRTYTLGEGMIGEVASEQIFATHDFTYARNDPMALEAAREQARESVVPVWDYDADLEEQVVDRIARGFRAMRRSLATRAQQKLEQRAREAGTEPPPPDALPYEELIAALSPQERVEVATAQPNVDEFVRQLQSGVSADALAALAQTGFSEQTERQVRQLVTSAMDRFIVPDIEVLRVQSNNGISLRSIRDDRVVTEAMLRDFSAFVDLRAVGDLIEQSAGETLAGIQDPTLRRALMALATSLATPNVAYAESETEARQTAAIEAVVTTTQQQQFREGQLIIDEGHIVTPQVVEIVDQMRQSRPPQVSILVVLFGSATLVVLLVFPLLLFARANLRHFSRRARDLTMIATVLVLHLALTRLGYYVSQVIVAGDLSLPLDALLVLLPFGAGAMLVRILTNAENSLIYAIIYAMLAGVLFDYDVSYCIYAFVSGMIGSAAVRSAQSRTDVIKAGGIIGLVMLGLTLGVEIARNPTDSSRAVVVALMAFGTGVTSAALVNALLPVFEWGFRYTTSMKLLELANLNHPALRELILHAPGTYHHSMMVGQLVEAACEAVGANALLGRVGSYYHDIGKMKNPQYFAENQTGHNPHDKLKPNMSALVIKSHVKDGVEMARQHRLPAEIIDFIREHHGTSLIKFFYVKAQEEADTEVPETDYRYPGPKPRSRETAICLLADGVEAASRALPDPTPARLKGLVQRMVNKAFIDGQLDDCDLTLKDLNVIAQAFLLRLTAFYHHRPEYPDAKKSGIHKPIKRGDTSGEHPSASDDTGSDHDRGSDAGDGRDGSSRPEPMVTEDSGVHLRRLDM